jgi:large subunit ribosomal protein L17
MRHQVAGYKLSRNKGQRRNLRRVMISQLFTHEKIRTTLTKAKFIRGEAERLITLARNSEDGSDIDKVNARRQAAAKLGNPEIVRKLFDDIGPRYTDRNGGYTRLYRLGPRQGDQAEMAMLELIEE